MTKFLLVSIKLIKVSRSEITHTTLVGLLIEVYGIDMINQTLLSYGFKTTEFTLEILWSMNCLDVIVKIIFGSGYK